MKPNQALAHWSALISETTSADMHALRMACVEAMRSEGQRGALKALEERWYASVGRGQPDWSIYDDPVYFAGLLTCWLDMSRRYLRSIRSGKLAGGRSLISALGPMRSVVDLGCGLGYTTAALTEMFPLARVVGTNLVDSCQMPPCEAMGERYGFTMVGEPPQGPVDLVFASEYFEHFEAPVAHLAEVLAACKPRMLLIANTFTRRSVGHFDTYAVGSKRVFGRETARLFGAALRAAGYARLETSLWNNRPACWAKS